MLRVHASFFQDKALYERMYATAGSANVMRDTVIGGIVPHHLAVGPEFARYYQSLRGQHPEVVVVLGPNHFEAGRGNILTTTVPYETPYGLLQADTQRIHQLTEASLIQEDDAPFAREHSISAEVAFVQKTFPKALLIPLILKSGTSDDDSERLGVLLSQILPKNSLVLASIDFSHYLPELAADFHDQTSQAVMAAADGDRFEGLEIDSAPTLHALYAYLAQKNALHLLSQEHTNSASYLGSPELPESTSHFFLTFGSGTASTDLGMSVLAFGDAMFDRGMRPLLSSTGDLLLRDLRGQENRFFRGSDVALLNLEGPVTKAPVQQGLVRFQFEASAVLPLLKSMNVNTVNLANNHMLDAGERGLGDTIAALTSAHIGHVGGDQACETQPIGEHTLAICGFDDSNHQLDASAAAREVAAWKNKADRLLVTIHWGLEYESAPTDRQRSIAHAFVDAGADAILGHHPHVIQPLQIYKGVPIVYSLGNFLFDQSDQATQTGLSAGLFFGSKQTILYLFPLRTSRGRPILLPYVERTAFLQTYLQGISQADPTLQGKVVISRP